MAALKGDRRRRLRSGRQERDRRTVFVETWGCQMNELDSRRFVGLMAREGYLEVLADEADLVLLNTCSVRDKAEQKVYDYLGRMRLESGPGPASSSASAVASPSRKGRRSSGGHLPSTSSSEPDG